MIRLAPGGIDVVPPASAHWRDEVLEAWQSFWSSPLSRPQVTATTDHPALRRLFDMRHRLLDALDAFDLQPVVDGSMGQATLSPWAAEVHRLSAAVSKLEAEFGLTPLSRMKLGVTFEEGVSLAARNAQLLAEFREGDRRSRDEP